MNKAISGRIFLLAALAALPFFAAAPVLAAPVNQSNPDANYATGEPTHFTRVITDLPLMPGLEPVEDEDVLFDAPGSDRIAETNAIGPVDADDVYKFYKRSLPHLGWHEVKAHTYRRESEELRIDARANQKITVVTFRLTPISEGR